MLTSTTSFLWSLRRIEFKSDFETSEGTTIEENIIDEKENQFTGGGERVAALGEDLHQVVGKVTAGQVETEDGVGKGVAFIDGDGVGDAVAGVEHDARGTTGGVEGEHGLDGYVHGRAVEGLEHDLYATTVRHETHVRQAMEQFWNECIDSEFALCILLVITVVRFGHYPLTSSS